MACSSSSGSHVTSMRSGGCPLGALGSGKRLPMWARTMPAPAPSAAPTSAPAGPPRAAPNAAPPAAPAITATRSSLAGPTLTLTVTFVFVFVTLVCDGLMLRVGLCTATPAVLPIPRQQPTTVAPVARPTPVFAARGWKKTRFAHSRTGYRCPLQVTPRRRVVFAKHSASLPVNVQAGATKASGYRVASAGAKGPSCWLGFAGQRARAFQAGLQRQAGLRPWTPQVRWA